MGTTWTPEPGLRLYLSTVYLLVPALWAVRSTQCNLPSSVLIPEDFYCRLLCGSFIPHAGDPKTEDVWFVWLYASSGRRKDTGHVPKCSGSFTEGTDGCEGAGRGGTQIVVTVVTSSDHAGGKLPRKQLTQHGYQLSPWRLPPCTGITEPVTQYTAYLTVGKSRRHPKGRKGNMLCARKDSQLAVSPAWPRCSSRLGKGAGLMKGSKTKADALPWKVPKALLLGLGDLCCLKWSQKK